MNTKEWVIKEFADTPFADDRLEKRLIIIANALYNSPGSSIPQACEDYSEAEATYRFFRNKRVKPEAIIMSHREQTIKRMRKYDTVLIVRTLQPLTIRIILQLKGWAHTGNTEHDLGFVNHTALAVTVQGVPLGLLSRQTWTRDPKELGKRATKNKRLTSDKESQKWLTALDESLKGVPSYISTVTVCDREADIYDFFNKATIEGRHILVRAEAKGTHLEWKILTEEIESKPVCRTNVC